MSNRGGGGGRIAVWRQQDVSALSAVTVSGGASGGVVGTIFWGDRPPSGTVIRLR